MPNTVHVAGATSKIITLRGITISTGLPYTAGAYNTSGLSITYTRDGATATTITPVTATAGTYTSSGFVHAGKGEYELGAPTAALAAGADGVRFKIDGVTDVLWEEVRVELTGTDPRSSTVPDVNVTKFGGTTVTARDIGASVLISSGTGTGQIAVTAGVVTANTTQISGTTQTARDIGASVLLSNGTGTGQVSLSSGIVGASLSAAERNSAADALLARNAAGGASSAPTVGTMLLASDLKFGIAGGVLTVYAHDGTTPLFTRTLTRATLDAIVTAS